MVFENFNIWPVKSVKTVIFLILSNPNEIYISGSVFNPEQEYIKKFIEISISDHWYQLKTVNSETISNVKEIRNCNSPLYSEQDSFLYS